MKSFIYEVSNFESAFADFFFLMFDIYVVLSLIIVTLRSTEVTIMLNNDYFSYITTEVGPSQKSLG